MTTYVAFLRGVNLGPHRSVSMARLGEIGVELGYQDVWTWVNSGNLVLTTAKKAATVEREVSAALAQEYGTTVDVAVRSAAELRTVLDANPFPDDSPSRVTVAFLAQAAPASAAERIGAVATEAEPYEVHGREVWVHYGDGQARSKLGAGLSRVVGVSATTRTVGTVSRILTKLEARASATS